MICKLYLVGFFCLSFFLNPLLIHRNTHTHTELNIHKILLIQSLFIYLYDKMVKAPCRSMKSDKGVKKKKKSTRTSQQPMEKSAVCYEARAAHNVMNGLKHTQEAALVSGVSELCSFVILPPHCPPILS